MIRHIYFPIWISFFLVCVLRCSLGASAPGPEVYKFFPRALLNTVLDWDSRLEIGEGNVNSISYALFPKWKGGAFDDSSLTLGWRTIVAAISAAVAATLSSAAGIGGGALYLPILKLLLEFDSTTSAALSSFMIFGGSLINLLWYFGQKHPDVGDKPLLDYDVSLLFQPNVLLGISIGVLCNVMSPEWLVMALLIVILSYTTFHSFSCACHRWHAESRLKRVLDENREEHGRAAVDEIVYLGSDQALPPISYYNGKEEGKDDLQQPLLESQPQTFSQYPQVKIIMLAFMWLSFVAVHTVEGIASAQDLWNIDDCGITYWMLMLSQLPLAVVMTACVIIYFRKYAKPLEDCEIVNARSLSSLPMLALVAGFIGGMLGLGGGMIMSPLLMDVGMHPQVTAATCSFMVFFSSSLSVVQYWFLGKIPMPWGLLLAGLTIVFSVIGLRVVHGIIVRFGRISVIQFVYTVVIGISAILMALFGSLDVWRDIEEGAYMGFSLPC